jgi:hypothetical protein
MRSNDLMVVMFLPLLAVLALSGIACGDDGTRLPSPKETLRFHRLKPLPALALSTFR